MKICILTQALHSNFGGLLQAFALQKVLIDNGFDTITDQKSAKTKKIPLLKKWRRACFAPIKKLLKFILKFFKKNKKNKKTKPNYIFNDNLDKSAIYFRDKYIKTSVFLENTGVKNKKTIKDFDAFIVGSDQVWRPRYNPNQNLYFLDFTKKYKLKRIAYAASFGKDSLDEFSKKDLKIAKEMLPLFDAISLREDSGVNLCKEHFNVEATHLLDPTLLLDKKDYLKLIEGNDISQTREKSLMVYILDENEEKRNIISELEAQLDLSAYIISPYKKDKINIENYQSPSISAWLAGYRDADFVLTDSFHGVVFSIIFNKNFIVINNEKRGSARFDSILKLFKLENRIISDISQLNLNELKGIDYARVNKTLKEKQIKSINFLLNALKKA